MAGDEVIHSSFSQLTSFDHLAAVWRDKLTDRLIAG
jgi:hypothetical protein